VLEIGGSIFLAQWLGVQIETNVRYVRREGATERAEGDWPARIEDGETARLFTEKLPRAVLQMILGRLGYAAGEEGIHERAPAGGAVAQEQNTRRALVQEKRFQRMYLADDRHLQRFRELAHEALHFFVKGE
jgi:hypothetical protein